VTRPLFILFLLGALWGIGYSIARFAMTHGVNPVGYTFWQSLGPAIILGLLSFKSLKFNLPHLKFYLICGLIGIAIPNTNMYFASAHLPAGLLALIVNTVPIMIYPLALLSHQEHFQWQRFAGVMVAVAGIMLLIVPHATLPQTHQLHWLLMGFITPFCFAFFALFVNPKKPKDSDPLSLAAGMLMAATLLLTPWIVSTHSFYAFHMPLNLPDKIILLEIILSSIGYVLLFHLIKIAGPVYYSLVDGLVALTGLAFGKILFDEKINLLTIFATFLILTGIALVNLNKRFKRDAEKYR